MDMRKSKTDTDDWSCVPELVEAVEKLDGIRNALYEVRTCQRSSKLDNLVNEIKSACQDVVDELENVDTDVEYITVYDDE
jgi:hypothetical protein